MIYSSQFASFSLSSLLCQNQVGHGDLGNACSPRFANLGREDNAKQPRGSSKKRISRPEFKSPLRITPQDVSPTHFTYDGHLGKVKAVCSLSPFVHVV